MNKVTQNYVTSKNARVSQLVEDAICSNPATITKNGRPRAVVLSVEVYGGLCDIVAAAGIDPVTLQPGTDSRPSRGLNP